MSYAFWGFIGFLGRVIFFLRYRVKTKGFEALNALPNKNLLFLPNHSAHTDPLLLFFLFWNKYRFRPLVIEYIYRIGVGKPFMKAIRAVSVPNFDTSVNQYKVFKAQQSLEEIVKGLKNGENFIMYPAGRLKNTGKEILGGASGAHSILQECPDVQVVLIRTTGLWGSSFSRAFEGHSLSLGKSFKHAVGAILKNFIFFLPRREILIECEVNPNDFPRSASRVEFNRYLENWYNQYPDQKGKRVDVEPLKLVSYSFWKKDYLKVKTAQKKAREKNQVEIAPETEAKIYAGISGILDRPNLEIKPEMDLAADLGMDSLNVAELIAFLSQNYDVGELHPDEILTVQDVLESAEGASKGEHEVREGATHRWPHEKGRPDPDLPVGKTMPESFLRSCERMKGFAACGDDVSGVLSYQKMKRAVLVLAAHFQKFPEKHIGVLLPASAGAYITVLAIQFAGKIPVMLNWTLGSRSLDEMAAAATLKIVISSWRFIERAQHVEFGSLVEKLQFLEDIRKDLSLATKLKGALMAHASLQRVMKVYKIDRIRPTDPCVILFTSGTEANPKGVPLSHKNIISNLRSAMQCLEFDSLDVLYGVLPPFHSFGFSVAGLFSLIAGMKLALFPDPTDSFALAEGIERWKVTLFCSPPSFIKGVFRAAKPEQLASVRWFVSGAEKAPPELFERVAQLGTEAKLIEGYGITECSPILSLTRPNMPAIGVGRLLPDVEMRTIHLETQEPLPPGKEGELCARGPNVFSGYLGNPRQAFIEIDGEQWYRTGDIGYIDPEGNLVLSGRLKRFTKISGEMISLGAVEEAIKAELIKQGKMSADAPAIALCVNEKTPGKPDLILFSMVSIDRDEINEILKNSGFSRLIKISSVQKINEIPLMGSGKTDYRRLQTMMA